MTRTSSDQPDKRNVGGIWARFRTALSPTGNAGDAVFRGLLFAAAFLVLVLVLAMIVALALESETLNQAVWIWLHFRN